MKRSLAVGSAANVRALERSSTAVCVPVRDERLGLPALLRALAAQAGVAPFRVCLLFDGRQPQCQARAEARARTASFTLECESIPRAEPANAGRARRAALAMGLAAVGADPRACVLTTDADSVPAPDWVAASLRALAEVDVVAGHVTRVAAHRMPQRQRLEQYLERLYRLERTVDAIDYDPAPSHPSLGGASLGFRAPVYRALGGFGAYANHEDIRIVDAARQAGYRLRHDRSVRVTTSARLTGRASGGLADELRRELACTEQPRVEHPYAALSRYRQAAAARANYNTNGCTSALQKLASQLALSAPAILAAAARAASADAFVLSVVSQTPSARDVDLGEAERLLARIEAEHFTSRAESESAVGL